MSESKNNPSPITSSIVRKGKVDSIQICTSNLVAAGRKEIKALALREKQSERQRASAASAVYAENLELKKGYDTEFYTWCPSRAELDLQDFQYLFYHRKHLSKTVRELLEIIASKITHTTSAGEDGYFNKLEQNIGWTRFITPIVFTQSEWREKLVRCGLWTNARNSRRCHKTDLCCFCNWLDHLKVMVEAFGSESGAFSRASAWYFITCGYTTQKENSRFVGKTLDSEDSVTTGGSNSYEAYPVAIGNKCGDNDSFGCNDARLLGLIAQNALDRVYKARIVDGYRNKLEGAFTINPRRGTRMNMHCHAIANGRETNAQYIAKELYDSMMIDLNNHQLKFWETYYPDVLVLRIATPEDLERCICYCEKVIPIDVIFAEAMKKVRDEKEQIKLNYVDELKNALFRLLDEYTEYVFTGYNLDPDVSALQRRKKVGNMKFSDRGTCIGDEPDWNRRSRQKKSAQQKQRRLEKKKLIEGSNNTEPLQEIPKQNDVILNNHFHQHSFPK